jgi:hypothetical protein
MTAISTATFTWSKTMREIETHEAANDGTPPPEYRVLEGHNDAIAAIDAVIATAKRSIAVFDVTLQHRGFNSPKRYDALKTFLGRSRDTRLRIVLHDESRVVADSPRLINLLREHPMSVAIHRTSESARHVADPLVIADGTSFWHHLHYEHPRSVLQLYDPAETAAWLGRFEEIWESSAPAITPTTLGL